MSNQHQTASKPDKAERRVEHHRERQATRTSLHVSDLEDVLDPPSVHNIAVPQSDGPIAAKERDSRHWKRLFWKRRTQELHHKNTTMHRLTD